MVIFHTVQSKMFQQPVQGYEIIPPVFYVDKSLVQSFPKLIIFIIQVNPLSHGNSQPFSSLSTEDVTNKSKEASLNQSHLPGSNFCAPPFEIIDEEIN